MTLRHSSSGYSSIGDPRPQHPGIIDEHVYPTEAPDRLTHKPLDIRSPRHVSRNSQNLGARIFHLSGNRAYRLLATRVHHDPRAYFRKRERERPAEALAGAGD